MRYFPVCLEIAGRLCLVVGGGKVAERKAKTLLACSGRVTVISPELTDGLAALKDDGALAWVDRHYRDGDLEGAFLVIAATDDPEVQNRINDEANKKNILLNVADVPQKCNFILPATVRRGDLTVSVSTGGKSPALAKQLRRELEQRFGPEYKIFITLLGRLRPLIIDRGSQQSDNERLFNELLHHDMLSWIKKRDWNRIEEYIQKTIGSDFEPGCLADLKEQLPRDPSPECKR